MKFCLRPSRGYYTRGHGSFKSWFDQRLDGVEIEAAAFTNFSSDHLDYHVSIEDCLMQKGLFERLCPKGKVGVFNINNKEIRKLCDWYALNNDVNDWSR